VNFPTGPHKNYEYFTMKPLNY